jgi:hypothetical protein
MTYFFIQFNMETNDNDQPDWFDELTEEQQQDVLIAIEQADRGEGIPHEEAMLRLRLTNATDSENAGN